LSISYWISQWWYNIDESNACLSTHLLKAEIVGSVVGGYLTIDGVISIIETLKDHNERTFLAGHIKFDLDLFQVGQIT
jgi:hypothetical protein